MKITDYINGKVSYDNEGQTFWVHGSSNGIHMLAELRGWGAIQNMFVKSGKIDADAAALFQDEIGEFIAQAINEKVERLAKDNESLSAYKKWRSIADSAADVNKDKK